LVFFVGVGEEGDIIAYNMNNRKVHPYTLHWVWYMLHPARNHRQTLLSSLRSLVLDVGVISKVVNKAAFDVSLCHDMFKWINVV
jgi:hypothetical protein